MKAHTPIAVLSLVSAAAHATVVADAAPDPALKAVADRLHATVIEVRTQATYTATTVDGNRAVQTSVYGTGVLIGGGLAITTLHTVGTVLPGRVMTWTNVEAFVPELSAALPAQVLASFPDLDLALLQIVDAASAEAAPLANEAPDAGRALVAIGIADDMVIAASVHVAGVNGDELVLSTTRRIDSRFWGGPLFDARGLIAGIILPSVLPRAISAAKLSALVELAHAR
jgi:hypothetical protein